MNTALGRFRPIIIALSVLLTLMVGWLILNVIARSVVGGRIERFAEARGLTAAWRSLRVRFPTELSIEGLTFSPPFGPPLVRVDSLDVEVTLRSVLRLVPRLKRVRLAHAIALLGSRGDGDPDTLAPAALDTARAHAAAEPIDRIRRRVGMAFLLLLTPAREIEHISIRDLTVVTDMRNDAVIREVRIDHFDHTRHPTGIELVGAGSLRLGHEVRWDLDLDYGNDDRILSRFRFDITNDETQEIEPLEVVIDGWLEQDRDAGRITLVDSTVVTIGALPIACSATMSREGPRIALSLAAKGITRARVVQSLPRSVLGPLRGLHLTGSIDARLRFDLDLARPEDVEIDAYVRPRGMSIDSVRTTLNLDLGEPFTATILLPGTEPAERDLSSANPFYRPLERIDSLLVNAVVTNEDGAFFEHGGFNLGAVKSSIAENLRAGGYRRGAGTITMQLARNLYTGHDRTLSRKAQEVVLAWVLEHLSGLSKQRLLEIYLNVIEWGPGVHGAGEAARYYFDRDVSDITIGEALFLSTVVPSPRKWQRRFDAQHRLRDFARAQMHFIGRAMIRKGWLDPGLLPAAESLHVKLGGAALAATVPPGSTLDHAARNLDDAHTTWPQRLDGGHLESHTDSVATSNRP